MIGSLNLPFPALVDRSDLMARVERAKVWQAVTTGRSLLIIRQEATRDSLVLDPKDGTDWARVYLQPEAWFVIIFGQRVSAS